MAIPSATWSDSVLLHLYRYQQDGLFCDTTLYSSEGKAFKAHSCVLASVSPFLKGELLACAASPSYNIRMSMSSRAVQCVILLAYTGTAGQAEFESEEISEAVNKLGMAALVKRRLQCSPKQSQNLWLHQTSDSLLSSKTSEIKLEHSKVSCKGKSETSNPEGFRTQQEKAGITGQPQVSMTTSELDFWAQPSIAVQNSPSIRRPRPTFHGKKMSSEQLLQVMESYSHEMDVTPTSNPVAAGATGVSQFSSQGMVPASPGQVIKQEVVENTATLHFCSFCQASFPSIEDFIAHEKSHVELNKHPCIFCGQSFDDIQDLESHKQSVHSETKPSFVCSKCNKTLATKESLTMHMRIHTGEKPHKCEYCDRRFTQKAHMLGHLRGHTGEKPYQCKFCDKRFARRDGMLTHERLHTKELPFQCTYCEKRFPYRKSLQSHVRTHTGERPHSCSYCDKTFAEKHHLVSHERIHTREMPYSCQYCERSFTYKTTLVTHERTHTGEMPYSCDICNQRFATKWYWKSHLKLDHNSPAERTSSTPNLDVEIPPYQCDFCDEPFFEKSQLTNHEKTHTRTLLSCQYCEQIFTQKSDLLQHEKSHTGAL